MIVKQPNGLYCLYDVIDDVPTKWNITKKEYIRIVLNKARKEALENLIHAENDIQVVYDNFVPDDDYMSKEQFDQFLKEIGSSETYESIHKYDLWGEGYDN